MSWKDQYKSLVRTIEISGLGSSVTIVDDLAKAEARITALWRKYLETHPHVEEHAVFVNLHLKRSKDDTRYGCHGVEALSQIVAEEPETFILVYSPLRSLRLAIQTAWLAVSKGVPKRSNKPDRLLSLMERNPKVQYLCIAKSDEALVFDINDKYERASTFSHLQVSTELEVTAGEVLHQRQNFGSELGVIVHDLDKTDSRIRKRALAGAKRLFPELPGDETKAVEFLRSQFDAHKGGTPPSGLQGRVARGLFVDAAGTLFSEDLAEISESVTKRILEVSKERWVYVWTGGDLNELGNALDRFEDLADIVMLPKQAFRGITVEEAIDDLSQDELEQNFCIKTLKYQHI